MRVYFFVHIICVLCHTLVKRSYQNYMSARVLLYTCNTDLRRLIAFALKKHAVLFFAEEPADCINKISKTSPQLIMLHDDSAVSPIQSIVEQLRAGEFSFNIKILVIAEKDEPLSYTDLLKENFDDIIFLPLSANAIIAATQRLLQQPALISKKDLDFKDLTIQPDRYTVKVREAEYLLPKKEFLLLYLLASSPGKIFSRDEIMESVWEKNIVVGNRTIDVHVRKIRQKINMNCIQTIKSVGYRFTSAE